MKFSNIPRASRLFQPISPLPKDADLKGLPKSQKLMLDYGFIKGSTNGVFSFLPLGSRVLRKLEALVRVRMAALGAQEVRLPHLVDPSLWKKSGRWGSADLGLFGFRDRHGRDYLLGPTHEEAAADLLSGVGAVSQHQLPLLLFQVASKFRDEIKPRCGLIRCKEFVMKDLYSFHSSDDCAKRTYNDVCSAYEEIFNCLELPVTKVKASVGVMGGSLSHEFHLFNKIGEDSISVCQNCSSSFNKEVLQNDLCESCGTLLSDTLSGVELGHTFYLGSLYSKPLGITARSDKGKDELILMSSYGLGLSRIMAASVEHLSDPTRIRWPAAIAPFSVVILPPKNGSKEECIGRSVTQDLIQKFEACPFLNGDILLDDRDHWTIGKRLNYARFTGFPTAVVIGRKALSNPPLVEVIDLFRDSSVELTTEQVMSYFSQNISNSSLQKTFCRAC